MERDDLVADEVVSRSETLRYCVLRSFVRLRHELRVGPDGLQPIWVGLDETLFLDLEPDRLAIGLVVLATAVWAACHISDQRTLVALRPQGPAQRHCLSCLNRCV